VDRVLFGQVQSQQNLTRTRSRYHAIDVHIRLQAFLQCQKILCVYNNCAMRRHMPYMLLRWPVSLKPRSFSSIFRGVSDRPPDDDLPSPPVEPLDHIESPDASNSLNDTTRSKASLQSATTDIGQSTPPRDNQPSGSSLSRVDFRSGRAYGAFEMRAPYPQAQVTSGLINGQHRRGLCNTAGAHILVGESMLLHLTMDCCSYIDTTQMNRKELENNPGGHEIFDAVRVVF